MLTLIRDLFAHQAWADSEMWRFLAGAPAAQLDPKVLTLLNHIHAVQRFFLSVVQGEPLTREELTREMAVPELRESYRRYHQIALPYLATMAESHLEDTVLVPWFPDFQPKVHEVLVQATTHSIHHRAQIATLIRQHGGEPKPTDYIVWAAKKRPAPQWEAATAA
jgi:uncharacterized damage-inducible protein DinB